MKIGHDYIVVKK